MIAESILGDSMNPSSDWSRCNYSRWPLHSIMVRSEHSIHFGLSRRLVGMPVQVSNVLFTMQTEVKHQSSSFAFTNNENYNKVTAWIRGAEDVTLLACFLCLLHSRRS